MTNNTQEQDFDYFLKNMAALYKTHGHKFAVIKNKGILGIYETFTEALETTIKTEEYGTFLVQELFADKDNMVHHFQGNVVPVPA